MSKYKIQKPLQILLIISGFIGILVGACNLINPIGFAQLNGYSLPSEVNILSEFRAIGGVLIGMGILISLGSFFYRLTYTSLLTSTIIYLSFGSSRIIAFIADGLPASSLVQVAILEIIFGLINLTFLLKFSKI